ncbi:MAG: hypothetical protein IKN43_13395, partial [Selenomonadaceae bacterium]|nr:hypothetical protein [Selenomonadaceae bacterium]
HFSWGQRIKRFFQQFLRRKKNVSYMAILLYRKANDGVFLKNHLVRQDRGFMRSEVPFSEYKRTLMIINL